MQRKIQLVSFQAGLRPRHWGHSSGCEPATKKVIIYLGFLTPMDCYIHKDVPLLAYSLCIYCRVVANTFYFYKVFNTGWCFVSPMFLFQGKELKDEVNFWCRHLIPYPPSEPPRFEFQRSGLATSAVVIFLILIYVQMANVINYDLYEF